MAQYYVIFLPVQFHSYSKEEVFNFEVVTINDSGKIINRTQGNARQKIENLGNHIQ
ncbi:hypothetical protein [Okeania sp. KiyG1]|uniref:hypothetical protein n=1 Tax=Okeania sp. KiyG1 TaxID=2720165 RepID=UPI0019BE98D6|nr:hypothetical protein CYANOKiyG1_18230 [Okeania sp. KiyG1]